MAWLCTSHLEPDVGTAVSPHTPASREAVDKVEAEAATRRPMVRRPCGDNAGGTRICDLEAHAVCRQVDADEHAVAIAELAVPQAVRDDLADEQLRVEEDLLRHESGQAVGDHHPGGAGCGGAGG